MPTIFWFLRTLAVLALLAYAAMSTLVWSVKPRQTEFSEPVEISLPEESPEPAAVDPGGESAPATPEKPLQ
jgi:hypothetical protein